MRLYLATVFLAFQFRGACTLAQERPPATAPVASSGSTSESEVPQVPGLSGLLPGANGGLTITGLHDAGTGWSTLWQPAFGYSFNDHFAIDVTIPIYMYRLSESPLPNPKPTALLIPHRGEFGDMAFGIHGQFQPRWFAYQATVTATAPTGDETNGLSTGRATFDLSNLFERSFSFITPNLELGVGDSTTLVNRLVNKNYTSLGPLSHYQIGASFPLPLGWSIQSGAYEILPIGDQKIYQSVKRKGTTTLVVTGHNVTEDNGFTNSLDIPLDRHTTLSAYYSRSLRQHDDIVSFSLTYVLRGPKPSKEKDDDALLQSIEQQSASPAPPIKP
jgi:hypothetical protein